MQNVLSNLSEIQGVNGYSVFDARGSSVEHQMPKPYEVVLISRVLDEVRSAVDPMRYVDGGKISSLVSRFESGTLVVREYKRHTVLVLTSTAVNMAMLNVALNVAEMKLERLGESPAEHPSAAAVPIIHEPPSASLSKSGSMNLTASPIPEGGIPHDAVGMRVMNELWKLMAPALGPAAKFVLKQQLKEMGLHAQTVVPAQFADLIMTLAPKIPNPEARNTFVAAARQLLASRG
jgi:hypothetical protein